MISDAIGSALDELGRDRMTGLVEEPASTSRVGQRLEDRFDGKTLGGYGIRVITETVTSHGSKSLEKPMGTDLYLAVEIEDAMGSTTSKGVLIQAKRLDTIARERKSVVKGRSVSVRVDIGGSGIIKNKKNKKKI